MKRGRIIDPILWRDFASERCPKLPFTTEWFDGTTHPVRVGFYERHFTDSMTIGTASFQYWDGKCWRSRPENPPHWRQVGDYPAWRGITEAQHKIHVAAGLAEKPGGGNDNDE